ncbi:MAG: lysophospholipid acyltransferase family protein [Chitinophagaceae bacterium]|nr:lysophospholipid acyltransferase family protein [Chitinophagaceae bacterium]MBL0054827.1 lysophospholipid acyltransferase family protein [Chitinophagaceae bacterium]
MYYIVYPLLYLLSLLPFFALYRISDFAYLILYRLLGYRKAIVLNNLQIAFPEKTADERKMIARQFYRNLFDTFIETIKLLSISEREFDKRAVFNMDSCNLLAAKGLNIQLQSGHQMNWEYVNWAAVKELKIPFAGIYMKLSNKALDRIFYDIRKKFGTILVAATEFRSRIHQVFEKQYSLAIAADQNPGRPEYAYWLNLFGRPTPFVTGPDKGARKNHTAVVFVKFVKRKRGYYEFVATTITEDASLLKEGELTLRYRDFLEATIREHPDNYLWSHRRWKFNYEPAYAGQWIDTSPPSL